MRALCMYFFVSEFISAFVCARAVGVHGESRHLFVCDLRRRDAHETETVCKV